MVRTHGFREWKALVFASGAVTAGLVATLAYPQAMRFLIDGLMTLRDPSPSRWLAALLALLLAEAATRVLHGVVLHGAASRISLAVEGAAFERILLQPIPFFEAERTVEMSAHLRASSETLRDFIARELPDLQRSLMRAFAGTIALLLTAPRLALYLAVAVPPLIVLGSRLAAQVKQRSREAAVNGARGQASAQESLGAIRVIRALGADGNETGRFSMGLASIHASNLGLGRLASWADGARLILTESVTLVAVGFGGQMVAAGHLSVGELVSFLIYADLTARAMRDLVNFRSHLGTVQGTLAPLGELLSRTERPPAQAVAAPQPLAGAMTLDHVEFTYPTRPASPVLKGLVFEVAPGECLAIVGESGSGKSTTLSLMAGFYQPTAGRVLLDGRAPEGTARGWQNNHIAYLPQGGRAFSRSMRENVLLGRDVSAEALTWAIRVSGLEAVLRRLPGDIDATPGESGTQVSGGEAQRLALARAICLKPAILLLDEATAALDPESEAAVLGALREPAYSPTLVIVSHRLSTIQRADRIVVLAGGRVDAVGRHDELIRSSEAYRRVITQRASLLVGMSEERAPRDERASLPGCTPR